MNDVKTKSQKVIRVGNSYAVTIDKAYIDKYAIKVSDAMSMTYYAASPMIKMSPEKSGSIGDLSGLDDTTKKEMKTAHLASEISPEFRAWVKQTLEEDKEAMEELAHL